MENGIDNGALSEGTELDTNAELDAALEEHGGAGDGGAPDTAGAAGAAGAGGGTGKSAELPELAPMPDGYAGDADTGAAGAGGLNPAGAGGLNAAARADDAHMPADVLTLLGVEDEAAAMERITQIAVDKLVSDGVPEAAAKEIIDLRKRLGGGRARDEPKRAAMPASAPEHAETAKPAAGDMPGLDTATRQAMYIQKQTGVDMLTVLKSNPELLKGVSDYASGKKGGIDMLAAYDKYRQTRGEGRAKVPATAGLSGGQTGGGKRAGRAFSDAEIDDIERRAQMGERIVL